MKWNKFQNLQDVTRQSRFDFTKFRSPSATSCITFHLNFRRRDYMKQGLGTIPDG